MSVQVKDLQPLGYEIVIDCRPINTGLRAGLVRPVKMLVINGDKRSVVEWAAAYGISYTTVKSRVNSHQPLERLFAPVKPKKKRTKVPETDQDARVYADAALAHSNMMRIFRPYKSALNKQMPYISIS